MQSKIVWVWLMLLENLFSKTSISQAQRLRQRYYLLQTTLPRRHTLTSPILGTKKAIVFQQSLVPRIGLEPTRLSTLAPETSASTISPSGLLLRKGSNFFYKTNPYESFFLFLLIKVIVGRNIHRQNVGYALWLTTLHAGLPLRRAV